MQRKIFIKKKGKHYIKLRIKSDTMLSTMNSMFSECHNLISLDLTSFDTSEVTTMNQMFRSCTNLFLVDISKFSTSTTS